MVRSVLQCRITRHDSTTEMLPEILSISQERNSAIEVTGALLCCDGWFLQVLEGPMVNVLETYGRVLRDSRVEDLTVVEAASVRERRFPEWGMCGLVLSSVDRQIIKTLETNGGFHRARTMPKSALKLLETVRRIQNTQPDNLLI